MYVLYILDENYTPKNSNENAFIPTLKSERGVHNALSLAGRHNLDPQEVSANIRALGGQFILQRSSMTPAQYLDTCVGGPGQPTLGEVEAGVNSLCNKRIKQYGDEKTARNYGPMPFTMRDEIAKRK